MDGAPRDQVGDAQEWLTASHEMSSEATRRRSCATAVVDALRYRRDLTDQAGLRMSPVGPSRRSATVAAGLDPGLEQNSSPPLRQPPMTIADYARSKSKRYARTKSSV